MRFGVKGGTNFYDIHKPSRGELYSTFAKEYFKESIEPYVLMALEHPDAELSIFDDKLNKTFTPEEFATRYGKQLEYDPNMTQALAEHILERKKEREANQFIISKGRGSIADYVAEFGIGAAMSLFDPIILGTAFIPIRAPALIAKYGGKLGSAIFSGAAGGLIGGAASEPIRAHGAKVMQEEYPLSHALKNIGLATAGGGMLGAGMHIIPKGAEKLKNIWKSYKTENIAIDKELERHFNKAAKEYSHPEGVKSKTVPLETLQKEKTAIFEELKKKHPELTEQELKIAEIENKFHHAGDNEGNLPDEIIEIINSEKAKLNRLKEDLSDNVEFQQLLERREKIDEEMVDTVKRIQYENKAYDLSVEDLHVAKEQLKEDTNINLNDPSNTKNIYETDERINFNNVDEELKQFFPKEEFDLTNPEIRGKAINKMIFAKNIDFVDTHMSSKVGLNRILEDTELRAKIISKKYLCDLHVDLEKAGLSPHFAQLQDGFFRKRNKKLELDTIRELSNLSTMRHPKGYTGSNIALSLAKIIRNHQMRAVDNANIRGANINHLPGYITRQNHSADALKKMGYEGWRDFIVPLLDLDKTGAIDLKQVYLNLSTKLHSNPVRDELIPYFSGTSNLSKKLGAERKLHFASPESWLVYNERCGEYNFLTSVIMNLEGLGKATGLLESLGTNPQNQLQNLKKLFMQRVQENVVKKDKIAMSDFDYLKGSRLDNVLEHIIGVAPENVTAAQIGRSLRSLKMMSALGRMVFSSIPDIGVAVNILQNNGIPVLKSYSNLLGKIIFQFGSKEKKEFAQKLAIASESMLGCVYDRLHSEDLGSGIISKMTNIYFKWNLMEWWDSSFKTAIGSVLSNHLAHLSSQSYSKLSNEIRVMLWH